MTYILHDIYIIDATLNNVKVDINKIVV